MYTQSYVANWDTYPRKPLPPLACQGTSPWAPFLFAVIPLHPPRLWGLLFHFLRDPLGKREQLCPDLGMNTTKLYNQSASFTCFSYLHVVQWFVMAMRSPSNQQMSWLKWNMSGSKFHDASQTLSRRTDSLRVDLMTNNYMSPCVHVCMEVRVPKKKENTSQNMDNYIIICIYSKKTKYTYIWSNVRV